MSRGIFLEPGQGTLYSARGSRMAFKALHEITGGAFSFIERDLPVGNRRPQLILIRARKVFTSWKGPSSSSSGEKAEKEVPVFGRQAVCRTHSATLATPPRDS